MRYKKSKTNFLIDVFMFVVMMLIAGLGILIKYILIPGKKQWQVYDENVDLTFLGLDRHQWGTIHLILGGLFFVLLIWHIVLHWNTIKCLPGRFISGKNAKRFAAVSFALICFLLLISPLLINVEVHQVSSRNKRLTSLSKTGGQEISKEANNDIKEKERPPRHKHHVDYPNIEIKGYMMLSNVADDYNIPLDLLKTKLTLPSEVSGNSRLGHLKKKYHFTMHEVEDIIYHYKNQKK